MKIVRLGHLIVLSLAFLIFGTTGFGQTTIASWGFENAVPITGTDTQFPTATGVSGAAADAGAQTAGSAFSGFHTGTATDWSDPVGNGSAESLSSNTWAVGDYYQFQFRTTGYTGISVSWDQTGSSTGPRDFKVQYSTDGTNFTDATGTNSTYAVLVNGAPNTAWSSGTNQPLFTFTLDLSGVTALNNKTAVYIRLVNTSTVSTSGATVAAGGSNRVDNFIARGTSSTAAGVGISGRVMTSDGRGITNAIVTITGNALASPITVITGRGGSYLFDDLEPGETYIVSVRSRRYTFGNPSQVINIVNNLSNADFVADSVTSRSVETTKRSDVVIQPTRIITVRKTEKVVRDKK